MKAGLCMVPPGPLNYLTTYCGLCLNGTHSWRKKNETVHPSCLEQWMQDQHELLTYPLKRLGLSVMGKETQIFRKEGEGVPHGRVTGSMLEAVSLLEIIWTF